MASELARNWWLQALRGLICILFGIGAFVWPGATLAALVIVFGAYVFVDGIFAVIAGIGIRRQLSFWWLVLLEGVAGIILGVLIFRSPDTTALVLLTLIATWSSVSGIFEIATALRIRTMITNEWLLFLSGVVSLVFGVLLLAQPKFWRDRDRLAARSLRAVVRPTHADACLPRARLARYTRTPGDQHCLAIQLLPLLAQQQCFVPSYE